MNDMKNMLLLTLGLLLWSCCNLISAAGRTTSELDDLIKVFEQNPANSQTTIQLLRELDKAGKPCQEVIARGGLLQRMQLDYRS